MMNTRQTLTCEGLEIGVNGIDMDIQRTGNVLSFYARGIQHQHFRPASLPGGEFLLQHGVQVVNLRATRFTNR
jgi:hypothetical protein